MYKAANLEVGFFKNISFADAKSKGTVVLYLSVNNECLCVTSKGHSGGEAVGLHCSSPVNRRLDHLEQFWNSISRLKSKKAQINE